MIRRPSSAAQPVRTAADMGLQLMSFNNAADAKLGIWHRTYRHLRRTLCDARVSRALGMCVALHHAPVIRRDPSRSSRKPASAATPCRTALGADMLKMHQDRGSEPSDLDVCMLPSSHRALFFTESCSSDGVTVAQSHQEHL